MSRSYKHFPCVSYIRHGFKRIANKRVRRQNELGNYKYYKKVFPTWDICDRKSIYSLTSFMNDYIEAFKRWPIDKYALRYPIYYYYKIYKWK